MAAISHWLPQKGIGGPSLTSLIQNIPEKEQISDFVTALSTANSKVLKESLESLGAKNIGNFDEAVEQCSVKNIWGLQKDDDITRIALEVTIRYHKNLAVQKSGQALFVFRLRDSKWQIEWFSPGAMLLPSNK